MFDHFIKIYYLNYIDRYIFFSKRSVLCKKEKTFITLWGFLWKWFYKCVSLKLLVPKVYWSPVQKWYVIYIWYMHLLSCSLFFLFYFTKLWYLLLMLLEIYSTNIFYKMVIINSENYWKYYKKYYIVEELLLGSAL